MKSNSFSFKITTNDGHSYNQNEGVFKAPVSRDYVFNGNLYSSLNGDVVSELMVNSDTMGGSRSVSETDDGDHISSDCVVVEIRQGDIVYGRTLSTHELQGVFISYP